MNMFYNAKLSSTIDEIAEVDDLIARVDKDPSILYKLSLEKLEKLNHYYEKIIEQKKEQIRALEDYAPPL